MRIVFIGTVAFSARTLEELIKMQAQLVGVCTLRQSTFNADHVDLRPIAEKANIPVNLSKLFSIPQNCIQASKVSVSE